MKKKAAFTIVEVLLALVILAMLTTAAALAFDASVKNYQANQGIYQTVNTARAALLRITNDIRTANAVALIADEPATQVSLITRDSKNITYRFDADDGKLYCDDNTASQSYVLCQNVASMTFNRTECQVERDNGAGGMTTFTGIRDVRIIMTVTDGAGKVSQTLAAAALVRRNL